MEFTITREIKQRKEGIVLKILKTILKVIFSIVFILIALINFMMVFGTYFDQVPIFGTIGNVFTVTFAHYWLIFVLAIVVICFVLALVMHSRLLHAVWIISFTTFLFGVFIIFSVIYNLNGQGGDTDFFKSYTKQTYTGVSKQTKQYEDKISNNSYLDIYYKNDGTTDKPVILYIHGGGWTSGSRTNKEYYLEQFAENGYIAVSAEYDLSTQNDHKVKTNEEQLTYAVAWIENNIKEYGGNTARFYLIGDSAGGNLALDLSYKINKGDYKEVETTVLPKVKAVSVLYPVTDMISLYHNINSLLADKVKEMVYAYMGTTPEEDKDLYDQVSPINYVSDQAPATLVLVGNQDAVVQSSQSSSLNEKLSVMGVDNKLIKVPFANHLFDMGGTNVGAQAYMNLTLYWFDNYQ